jgi:glyoxylase-like metal-dependent hydrolase (beta-lactamase superfamily II)
MPDGLTIEHLSVGPLQCTCTIVADATTGEAIVVDGGDDVDAIVGRLDALGVKATHLVHTHAHIDHIGALGELRERTGGVGLLHPADLPLYSSLAQQARFLGVPEPTLVTIDGDLAQGDTIAAGRARLDVLHTPGHTPGSVSFAVSVPDAETMLLTGDTLFRGARRHRAQHPDEALRFPRRNRRYSGPRAVDHDRLRKENEPVRRRLTLRVSDAGSGRCCR